MPKSSLFGGRRSSTDVNVISSDVQRSSVRRAKTAFLVCGLLTWVLASLVLASYLNPILAVLVAALVAVPVAGVVFVAVWIWPVVRILIHWSIEITVASVLLAGMSGLYHLVAGPLVIVVVLAVAGVLLAPPALRHRTVSAGWCVISRHRLRMSFAAFIRTNREGTLPFILHATPTPVGERVWVWLRPGLSLAELRNRGDQLAVSCWAKNVTVESASTKYAALLRFDIKRRDTLSPAIASPLTDVPGAPIRETGGEPSQVTALDLTDVSEEAVTPPAREGKPAGKKPAMSTYTPTSKAAAKTAEASDGDDLSDWI